MLYPKKSLGQNFIIDQNIIKKILFLGKVNESNIVEIGPGTGNLTRQIIKYNPKSLTLIEKDTKLCDELKKNIKFDGKLKIFNNDILKFDLEKKIKKNSIIFGNLPYNISTQILVKLLKFKNWPPKYNKLILMFQKEVAERILANYNTNNYGRLSVISNFRLKVLNSFNVSKNCFFPKPKVDSTVLLFQPITNKSYNIKNIENLEKITQIFFSNRRKMINKNFKKLFNNSLKLSEKLKLDLSFRPSQISNNQYYKIVQYYEMSLKKK
tara:strand:- start:1166 stop:1966 length:801 start_codon:yes stop_codon:yes gene_type:complete